MAKMFQSSINIPILRERLAHLQYQSLESLKSIFWMSLKYSVGLTHPHLPTGPCVTIAHTRHMAQAKAVREYPLPTLIASARIALCYRWYLDDTSVSVTRGGVLAHRAAIYARPPAY